MPPDPDEPSGPVLVREGWGHLRQNRPLAAWASWQRALRLDPAQPAARLALERLADAPELPGSARIVRRFRTPADPEARARWDRAFRGRDLADLDDAADAFEALVAETPDDADAVENRSLCLAWLGRNGEAVAGLDRVVALTARDDAPRAVSAWTLAEILRQGAADADIAEEFSHAIDLSRSGDPSANHERIARRAVLRELPTPVDPAADPAHRSLVVEEWIDRPQPDERSTGLRLDELPRVVAVVFSSDRVLRLSVPDASMVGPVLEVLQGLGIAPTSVTRSPLPLALLDAAAWTIRLPDWADDDDRRRLTRENVEDYYENRWINRPRRGLGDRTPVEAARIATAGDLVLSAKLEAVVGLLEELSRRPSSVELYQGYPFDRLRRRLGLTLKSPEAVDPGDPGCMSGPDLDALDPAGLDDNTLADAFRSASALGDDARTARFASALLDRNTATLARLDLRDVFACLVRFAVHDGRPRDAIGLVDRAIDIDETLGGRRHAMFTTWRAEILAGLDEPEEAARVYTSMLEDAEAPAQVALDGATTLLDHGHLVQAADLAQAALRLARDEGDSETALQAEAILDQIERA